MKIDAEDVAAAWRFAEYYRMRGWNVLPMKYDETRRKKPAVAYAEYWERPFPLELFQKFPSPGMQIMLGRFWRLLAIDLDGDEARQQIQRMGAVPRTWISHSGGDGLHLWFTVPRQMKTPMPKTVLWQGEGRHSAIERLCDRSLLVVPPSVHPTTGVKYTFLDPFHSPATMPLPAAAPSWVLTARGIEKPREAWTEPPKRPWVQSRDERCLYRIEDVMAAVSDKAAIARQWGLRFAERPMQSGEWISVHAIGRPDIHPSARFSVTGGGYWEPTDRVIPFFELAVRLGIYSDWRDALNDIGKQFHVRPR